MAGRSFPTRRLAAATVFALLLGVAVASLANAQADKKPPKKDPVAKVNAPWPDASELARRREQAEKLPLFATERPLAVTISAPVSDINKDRKPDSAKRFPGVVQIVTDAGATISLPAQVGSRGHARLDARVCSNVPLRIEFAKKDVNGTVFDGQRDLKLVVNCQNDSLYEQYILTEYLAYKLYGLFTARSFRARLVRVTYVDTARNRTSGPRWGILIEHDDHVADRLEARIFPFGQRMFSMLDQDSLTLMALLQYMIGNTDYSIFALHNVKLVRDQRGTIYPLGYDFDYSGLVNARYAAIDPRLKINSVRDRLYRGPCRTVEQLEPFLTTFRARKSEILALVDTIPDMQPGRRDDARKYLGEFLSTVENPKRAKRDLVDGCTPGRTM